MKQAALTFTFDLPEPHGPHIIIPHLHRLPPKPPWLYAYYLAHQKTRWGHCEWCGEGIHPGQRKNPMRCTWHLECVNEFNILFNWQYARRIVKLRDKGICQSCGRSWRECITPAGKGMEVDHIVPLHQCPSRDIGNLTQASMLTWYAPWLLPNLQTLCVSCHKAKSALERTRRAANL